jgi:hypothetical protein
MNARKVLVRLGALPTAAGFALLACGESKRSAAQVDDLGTTCGDARPVVDGAVEIESDTAECEGVCLHSDAVAPPGTTSPGECSCRCDGPANTGPFCACATGYTCEPQIAAVGLGNDDLAGSYCVARR